ncbi:DUF4351 domain-containing protein, partial [Phormidium sp. CCY1219]|uniref:DUF4351 domain-containing protein n=1 Tax=Phormidium sp. CCY1219 TaxID=2886104 RepID=UPI002D1E6E71
DILQKGLEQGLEQGKKQEAIAMIMRQLNRRFGTLEPEVIERIRELSTSQLEELSLALLDFSEVGDLATWLQSC